MLIYILNVHLYISLSLSCTLSLSLALSLSQSLDFLCCLSCVLLRISRIIDISRSLDGPYFLYALWCVIEVLIWLWGHPVSMHLSLSLSLSLCSLSLDTSLAFNVVLLYAAMHTYTLSLPLSFSLSVADWLAAWQGIWNICILCTKSRDGI